MNWKHKARLANFVAKLPPRMSYSSYYFIQRHFGTLRTVNPERALKGGLAIIELIGKCGSGLTGAETFLEVGTGRCLALPIALWLCGAHRIITVDLNPYLKSELVFEEIDYIRNHQSTVRQLFASQADKPGFCERLDWLVNGKRDMDQLLSGMNVQYMAPADAGKLALPSQSIDYHVSFMVLQHVRPDALVAIFREGKRLLKAQGLSIHYTNVGDLFAGIDPSIGPLNFLQFDEQEWESIAGNRYMYHNRLRVDELRGLCETAGLRILSADALINQESLGRLKSGQLALDHRFRDKSPETNATDRIWLTATPC
jgi:hypothetical protein